MQSQKYAAFPIKYLLLLIALSLIGTGSILFATHYYGVGFSPDSVYYLSLARDLKIGLGIEDLTISPPLYPALLALSSFILKNDPIAIAHIINAVAFGLVIFLSGVFYKIQIKSSPSLAILGSFFVLVSVPLIQIYLMAWTEPVFILFVLLYILSLDLFLKKESRTLLFLFSLCAALACLTRYIGILLIPLGMISIFFYSSNNLTEKKIQNLVLFVFVSTLPIGVWITKNYFVSGTLSGVRYLSPYTYYQNLISTSDSLLSWFLPERLIDIRLLLMVIGTVFGFLIGIGFRDGWFLDGVLAIKKSPVLPLVVAYIGFLLISSETAFFQLIDNRFLSPVFIPMNLLFLIFLERGLLYFRASSSRLLIILFWISIGAMLIYPFHYTFSAIQEHRDNGTFFTSKSWRQSETIQFLQSDRVIDSGCSVYSNGVDVIYLLTNMDVNSIPAKSRSDHAIADLSSLENSWPQEDKACIVWFNEITWRTSLYTPDEITSVTTLEDVIQLDDGAIYFVSKK